MAQGCATAFNHASDWKSVSRVRTCTGFAVSEYFMDELFRASLVLWRSDLLISTNTVVALRCLSRPWLAQARLASLFSQPIATAMAFLPTSVQTHLGFAIIRDPAEKCGLTSVPHGLTFLAASLPQTFSPLN